MSKIIFIVFILIALLSGLYLGYYLTKPSPKVHSVQSLTNNTQKRVFNEKNWIKSKPERLIIPKLQINAGVESVGLDTNGNMDTPKHNANVGWYNLGYYPGEPGNAVMAGHLDASDGKPAVFWRLDELQQGDEVILNKTDGHTLRYKVIAKAQYLYNDFPIQEVFGSSNESKLNLITCGGVWDKSERIYSHRTVVYTQLVK